MSQIRDVAKDRTFLIDMTRCTGCRGCQVACKQWNGLRAEKTEFFSGEGYQNPPAMSEFTFTRGKFRDYQKNGQNEFASEGQKADAVVDLLQGRNFRTRRVVTAVSGKSVIVRYLTMVRMSDEDLRNAIRFEADKYIPFDVEEVVLDAQRMPDAAEKGDEMRVLLCAVKRSLIDEQTKRVARIKKRRILRVVACTDIVSHAAQHFHRSGQGRRQ